LGRVYLERAASVLRTSDKGCTSVPSPCANQANGEPEAFLERKRRSVARGSKMGIAMTDLQMVSKLTTVATPRSEDSQCAGAHRGLPDTLHSQAQLAHMPTPQTHDDKLRGNTEADNHYSPHDLSNAAILASVPTPTVADHNASQSNDPQTYSTRWMERESHGSQLAHTTQALSTVCTPSARDYKDTSGMFESGVDPDGSIRSGLDQLPRQAQLAASGPTATGGTAKTASTGQLDPAYSRWLMGVPPEWDGFVCTATRSVSRRRRSSSGRTGK